MLAACRLTYASADVTAGAEAVRTQARTERRQLLIRLNSQTDQHESHVREAFKRAVRVLMKAKQRQVPQSHEEKVQAAFQDAANVLMRGARNKAREAARKAAAGRTSKKEMSDEQKAQLEQAKQILGKNRRCRLPAYCRTFGHVCITLYILGCAFAVLLYGLRFDDESDDPNENEDNVALTWLLSSILTTALDAFLNQPVGIVATSLISIFVTPHLADWACPNWLSM